MLLGLRSPHPSGSRPEDDWLAWCVDEATHIWGAYVEGELEAAAQDNKKKNKEQSAAERRVKTRLELLMRDDQPGEEKEEAPPPPPGKFQDPAAILASRKARR